MIFALAAQRLSTYYEHGQWLTDAQGASLAAEWLARGKGMGKAHDKSTTHSLPLAERRHLAALSDELARGIADSLSREAGLFTAHEMNEALDPNYHSELAETLMTECERLLDRGNST